MIYCFFCLSLFLALPASQVSGLSASSSSSIRYRPGMTSDARPITLQLAKELMNPFEVKVERFIVAYDSEASDDRHTQRVGWAQIRPLPGRREQIERETDDVMWDEFEENRNIQVPVGLQSLPWTKEYREFSQAAAANRRREQVFQETANETPVLYEISSVWVDPRYRKRGIGTEVVRRVLQRHVESTKKKGAMENVYLLTLATTSNWYRKNFGFQLVPLDKVPEQMAFETKIGTVVAKALGSRVVCMQGDSDFDLNKAK